MSIQTGSLIVGAWPDHPITVDTKRRVKVEFTEPFESIPKIHTGLTTVDNDCGQNTRISVTVEDISNRGFVVVVSSWADSITWQLGIDWIATDVDDCICERSDGLLSGGWQQKRTKIRFARPFSTKPDISVAIALVDAEHSQNLRVKLFTENITATDFDLIAETWSDTIIWGIGASWFATTNPCFQIFPEQRIPESGIIPQRLQFHHYPDPPQTRGPHNGGVPGYVFVWDGSSLPQVFKGVSLLDTAHDRNIRVRALLDQGSLSPESCVVNAETWCDSITYSMSLTIVGVVGTACPPQFVDATSTGVVKKIIIEEADCTGKGLPPDYVNLGKLASGWWGTTYQAKHRVDDGYYCIKHIHRNRHEHWALLKAELRNLTMLPYQENIVRYHHSTIFQDQLFIVTELIVPQPHGPSTRGVSKDRVLRWARQMFLGLSHLHGGEHPIVHRDLHMGNILVKFDPDTHYGSAASGAIKIIDVGLAKQMQDHDLHRMTHGGGTNCYFSPERRAGSRYNEKDDVWAIVCMITELATGKLISRRSACGSGGMDFAHSSCEAKVEQVLGEVRSVSARLGNICESVLRKRDPASRPSAADIVTLIADIFPDP